MLAGVLMATVGCGPGGAAATPTIPTSPAAPTAPASSASSAAPASPATRAPAAAAASTTATVLAVGDIADCGSRGDDESAAITARLLKAAPRATILTLGDHAYPDGSTRAFRDCYQPSWGKFTPRVRPVPGNHDYGTRNAAGYFAYFGKAAGPRGKGYYSFNLGAWHVVALNSNCDEVGGCGPSSPQGRWLRADLAIHRSTCTLAYWHHPRFSSGEHGSDRDVSGFWSVLQAARADVVLGGHDHDYERFAPQGADGRAAATGIREFVVGTGGADQRDFAGREHNSQRRITGTDAVLQLRLTRAGYRWSLVGPGATSRPLDSGSGTCSKR